MTYFDSISCTLNNGIVMPSRGLGTAGLCGWRKNSRKVTDTVLFALETGYRHLDTSPVYGNEASIGTAIFESGISRKDIFVSSKLPIESEGVNNTITAFHRTLDEMSLDYLDLYLIHWPVDQTYLEIWKAMEKLYDKGLAKAIGVCNFKIQHLKDLIANFQCIPVCNQVEIHPFHTQSKLRKFCKTNDIQILSSSPLGAAQWKPNQNTVSVLREPLILELAMCHAVTPAQIVLAWHQQNELVAIPKSDNRHRIRENLTSDAVRLAKDELYAIDNLNRDERFGKTPDRY